MSLSCVLARLLRKHTLGLDLFVEKFVEMEVLRSAAFVPSSARVLRRRCRVTCTVYEPTRHSRAKVLVSSAYPPFWFVRTNLFREALFFLSLFFCKWLSNADLS